MGNWLVSLACLLAQLYPAVPPSCKDSTRHDVGIRAIIEPGPLVAAGHPLQPAVDVVNLGTETEKYFDIRFRIDGLYDEILTVESVKPGTSVRVVFPEWVATAGTFLATCSTMLARDSNPTNDTASLVFTAIRPLHLQVGDDLSTTLRRKETKDFVFYAKLSGDTGATVNLAVTSPPQGWTVSLRDSTGRHEISGLGRLAPGQKRYFRLRLTSPDSFSLGHSTPDPVTLVVRAYCPADNSVADEAHLQIIPVPDEPDVHNFPNPFRRNTVFQLNLPQDGIVSLTVYNRAAELVATVIPRQRLPAGYRFFSWAGCNEAGEPIAPGIYQYLLEYSSHGHTSRIVKKLVKTTGVWE